MNDVLDDDVVVARLRSALDELTARESASDGLAPMRTRVTVGPTRWLAVAAAGVLVVAGIAAIAVNHRNAPTADESDTTVAATSAPAAATTTTEYLIRTETPFFTIASADLVPGERTLNECCTSYPAPGSQLVMAWTRPGPPAFLTLTEYSGPATPDFTADATVRELESATLLFQSVGFTAEERESLADLVVAGSGLPYVLPIDGWTLVGMGQVPGGDRLTQLYTPLDTDPVSSYMPTVTMTVGEYRGEIALLALWPDSKAVTVAGYEGWKVTDAEGRVTVFWSTLDGNWATMEIDAQLADRVDGLIAAVVEVDPTQPTIESVPAP